MTSCKGKAAGYVYGRFYVFIASALVVLATACELNIETLRVVRCTPGRGVSGIERGAVVEIVFSADVNRIDAEELFLFENGDGMIRGEYTWVGGSMFIFTPSDPLEKNGRYTITVPRNIRDTKGNTMGSDFLSDFYIGNDFTTPRVLSSIPSYNGGLTYNVDADQDISIDFSKSMNTGKTIEAFSISPEASGYFVWSESSPGLADSRLEFRLTEPLVYGKLYRLKLSEDAEDDTGNRTALEYMVNFIVGNDTVPPEVMGVFYIDGDPETDDRFPDSSVRYGVSRKGPIMIEFSEDMDRQSVEKALCITPSVSGYFDWGSDRVVSFRPSGLFDPETLYQLKISNSCMDRNGISMARSYAVEFRTDAPDSLFIKAGQVSGSNDNISYSDSGGPWPWDIEMGDSENTRYYIRIRFMSSLDPPVAAEIEHYSIFDRVLLDTTNYTAGTVPPDPAYISDISWESAGTVVIQLSGMTNDETGTPALYRLTVTGGKTGIRDINSNYMKEDFVIEFREVQ